MVTAGDAVALSAPSVPPKHLRSASHQTCSDESPLTAVTTGRIPSIFTYGQHIDTPEKVGSPLQAPGMCSTGANLQPKDSTAPYFANIPSPIQSRDASPVDMEERQIPRLSANKVRSSEDDDQDEFFSAEGGSTPLEYAEKNRPPPSDMSGEVSFGSPAKIPGCDIKQSSPLSLSKACDDSPLKNSG